MTSDQLVELGLSLVSDANDRGAIARLCGGSAVLVHCGSGRKGRWLSDRVVHDIDVVVATSTQDIFEKLLATRKFFLDPQFAGIPESRRSVFYQFSNGNPVARCDVQYDEMSYCHRIDLRGRMVVDYPTIPLAELLLSKLQIRAVTQRDFMDIVALLVEHEIGDGDLETINLPIISAACGRDFGLWQTLKTNCERHLGELTKCDDGASPDCQAAGRRLRTLVEAIDASPKSLRWRLAAQMAEWFPRMRWYSDVEELAPPSGPSRGDS